MAAGRVEQVTAIQRLLQWDGMFSGGRYVQLMVIQRWPLSRFDCINMHYIDNGKMILHHSNLTSVITK